MGEVAAGWLAEATGGCRMTTTAYQLPTAKETRTRKASEALLDYILRRIRKVMKDQTVLSDATGSPEWVALASLDRQDDMIDAAAVRDALIAAIIRGLRVDYGVEGPDIRVAYARILAMLVDYLWVAKHPYEREHWPSRDKIGEW